MMSHYLLKRYPNKRNQSYLVFLNPCDFRKAFNVLYLWESGLLTHITGNRYQRAPLLSNNTRESKEMTQINLLLPFPNLKRGPEPGLICQFFPCIYVPNLKQEVEM